MPEEFIIFTALNIHLNTKERQKMGLLMIILSIQLFPEPERPIIMMISRFFIAPRYD